MKPVLSFFFAFCFAITASFCQETVDVIQLKNGEVYRGTIVKKDPDGTVELRVGQGNIMVFTRDEIRRLTTEDSRMSADSLNLYGRGPNLGFAIGGGGLLGVPFRTKLGNNSAFEIGPFVRPFILSYSNAGSEVNLSLLLAASINFNLKKKYNPQKQKVVANGLFIRGGTSFGKYKESLVGFGWAGERFKKSNRRMSFIHELGPGIIIRHWFDEGNNFDSPKNKVGFVLAWKVHINSYLK
jgi:hypothetical protein